ncbi:unnamed protein product [Pleuronectes platessa]|uniref:PWWP domain-containing protein n=1 Tax=Pleuronectes platessa TaxID=8262 RepID=A0A9N7VWQ4_PLEPL|nr:unnamed protein product [Pleuronectes platessa]
MPLLVPCALARTPCPHLTHVEKSCPKKNQTHQRRNLAVDQLQSRGSVASSLQTHSFPLMCIKMNTIEGPLDQALAHVERRRGVRSRVRERQNVRVEARFCGGRHRNGRNHASMSGPHVGPGRDAHQSICPLTPGRDLSTHSNSSRHDNRFGLTMSAAASSLKHASLYGFAQRDHPSSSSSSSSSYSPLRRLQHLTTMVSQPDLVLPVREPERSWEWGTPKKERGKEMDSWADCTGRDYSVTQGTSREESFGHFSAGRKQPEVQSGSRDTPAANQSDPVTSEKKTDSCFSGPPSPAFSLDSNSPFANGFLHFESSLFDDDDTNQVQETVSPIEVLQEKNERAGNTLQSTPGDVNLNSRDTTRSSAKVVTRSQSSGQRRRYWDGSDDEWESDTGLLLFMDSPAKHSMNSVKKKSLPPVKFLEGEIIWAKFSRRPWWPCEVIVDPVQGVYHRLKEPSDRPCRLYHIKTFGEPVEHVWLEEKSTHTFNGGFEFEQLLLMRRRGKQTEKNSKYTIAKRFQESWKSSVAEAESILPERSKMASSISVSMNDGSHISSILEKESKALPTSSPSPSPVSTLPETLHGINGSLSSPVISSPITTPAKSSTLRKSSGKKKPILSSGKSKKVVQKSKQVPDEVNKVVLEQPAHLPASSRLLTRALKAMQEVEQKKQENAKKQAEHKELLHALREVEDSVCHSARNSSRGPKAKLKISTKIKSLKSKDNGEHNQGASSSRSIPPARSSDSTDIEADVKSEAEDHSISSTPPMDFIPLTSKVKEKNDDHSSALCSSSSPSSPFSFMNAFKNVEEVSFQSVTSEGNGKPVSFKPDTNYKFSTFLMMLKDLHDTREREGTPLELDIGPPSTHVKEEPSVMPGEAKPAGQDQQFKHLGTILNLSPDKIPITNSVDSKSLTWKRPYNRRSSCTGMKKRSNRKVPCRPARSGPGFPGLESTSRIASLPTAESSSRMDCLSRVQSLLGMQASSWERLPEGGEGVVQDEADERWSRVNLQNLQNMVPLEQQGSDTTLRLGQPNGLFAGRTKTNPSFTHNAGGRDKATTGKSSWVGPNLQNCYLSAH